MDQNYTAKLNVSEAISSFNCQYTSDTLYWQLGCIIATIFFLIFQWDIATVLACTRYKDLCKTHCKCFYVAKQTVSQPQPLVLPISTTNNLPPPNYHQACEASLPTYDSLIDDKIHLPNFAQAVNNMNQK